MKTPILSRRDLLKSSLAGAAGMVATKAAFAGVAACNPTPPQTEGPYYPQESLERDSDLTQIESGSAKATGQVIYVTGTVTDVGCLPLKGAMLEIWQACYSGKYNHSDDPNPLKLDSSFQFWGRARTDAKGNYMFKTIVPGHYPVGEGRYRPPHIHFKVYGAGFYTLTTQMYFNPKSYDDLELGRLVDELNRAENVDSRLIVQFDPAGAGLEPGAKLGKFDISLKKH